MIRIKKDPPIFVLTHEEISTAIADYVSKNLDLTSGMYDANVRCDSVTRVPIDPPARVVVTAVVVPTGGDVPRITDEDVLVAVERLYDE